MDINQYLEDNCNINEYNDNLIEKQFNEFNFYSIYHYEILEKENVFNYSNIFKHFYLSKLFNLNNTEMFTIKVYKNELIKLSRPYLHKHNILYRDKFKTLDNNINTIREEITELKNKDIHKEIKELLIQKENIQKEITNKDKSFELISLNDKLDTIDKTIKTKNEKLNNIPLIIKNKNKEIDILKKDILYYITIIKLFDNFPIIEYHKYLHYHIDKINNNVLNKKIKVSQNILFTMTGLYFMLHHLYLDEMSIIFTILNIMFYIQLFIELH